MTKTKTVRKVRPLSWYKKELDRVFSLWVRKQGNGRCYTCNRFLGANNGQCGHFISRSYLATRWDEDNCRQQCVGCNLFGGGKPLDFEEHLVKEIGKKRVEALKKKRHEITILTNTWYEEKIAHYKSLL